MKRATWIHNACTRGVVPNASERQTKKEVAQKWAYRLQNRCRLAGPQNFGVGGKIKSGPQVGRVPT